MSSLRRRREFMASSFDAPERRSPAVAADAAWDNKVGRWAAMSDLVEQMGLVSGVASLREARSCFEREYIAAVLEQHGGRVNETAIALGVRRTNLYRKMRSLDIPRRSPAGRR